MILAASPIFQRAVPPTWPVDASGFSMALQSEKPENGRSPFAPRDDPAEVHIPARDQDRNTIQLALYKDQKKHSSV